MTIEKQNRINLQSRNPLYRVRDWLTAAACLVMLVPGAVWMWLEQRKARDRLSRERARLERMFKLECERGEEQS